MQNPFGEIQQLIQQLVPMMLLVPGVVLTAMGLFLWLGGLRFLRSIASFTAGITGFACAWVFTGRELLPMVLLPVIAAGLGMVLKKPVVVLLGAAIGGLIVLTLPVISDIPDQIKKYEPPTTDTQQLNLLDSIQQVEIKAKEAAAAVRDYFTSLPKSRLSLAAVVAVGVAGTGIFASRLVCAATCSVIGTCLIVAGMTLLLLFKGSQPFDVIAERGPLVGLIIVIMICLGTVMDLWLCPKKKKKKDIVQEMNEVHGK